MRQTYARTVQVLRFTLYAVIIYLTGFTLNSAIAGSMGNGTHFCGVIDGQPDKPRSHPYSNRRYARSFAANLNVGEPRTVRMIYFLPNDRPYQADVVQRMKDVILMVQTFFAEQMEAHGYGKRTFRVETDAQGEPIVHRVDGRHPDNYYLDDTGIVYEELTEMFNHEENIYLTVIDISTHQIDRKWGGIGYSVTKRGGKAYVTTHFGPVFFAHELGHAFGLQHDFNDGEYIMSYGPEREGWLSARLSECHADSLSVHTYFNSDSPIETGNTPTITLISPRSYPAGETSVPIQIKVDSPDGLRQIILYAAQPDNRWSVKSCRAFSGERSAIIDFGYDGVIPSAHDRFYSRSTSLSNPLIHPIVIEAIDMNGDVDSSMWDGYFEFVLFSETLQPLSKIAGDNQAGGLPNTPLPLAFVVEVRNLDDGFPRAEVPIRFTVTRGGGTLSVEHTETDWIGHAKSTLTLGPNLGTNTVEVSAGGIGQVVTFQAVAEGPIVIPDAALRAAIESTLDKTAGAPIAKADMTLLLNLVAANAGITNLTGLEHAANLTELHLWRNSVKDLSPVAGLAKLTGLYIGGSSASDLSPLAELIYLESLFLDGNGISDLSAMKELTNLTRLALNNNSVSDLLPLAGLTNLRWMRLVGNNISDLSPLVTNMGLGIGDEIDVRGNPLSYLSIHTRIPALRSRGIIVEFDNRTLTSPLKISGDDQQGTPGTALERPFVVEVRDAGGSAFEGVPGTFTVTSGGGTLSLTSATTDSSGRAESILTLGPNPGTNTVTVSVTGIQEEQTFTAEGIRILKTLEIVLGDDQEGLPGAALDKAFVVEVRNQSDKPLPEVQVTFTITAGGGTLSTTRTMTDENGKAESALTLGPNLGTNTVEVSAAGIEQTVTFNAVAEVPLDIPDPNLRAVVETALGKASGAPITVDEMANLTGFAARNANINDLTGLEHAINLKWLGLDGETVGSTWNNSNSISDLSPLAGLTNLTQLWIGGNSISDISPLAGLTNLTSLTLEVNRISDISPLVANTGLGEGDTVYVRANPLNSASIKTHIPTLVGRGVTVEFDDVTPQKIRIVSGNDQPGLPGAALDNPFLVEVRDQTDKPLPGVEVTFSVTRGDGTLSLTSATTDSSGRAQSTLTLGPNPGTNTVTVSVTGIQAEQTFNAEGIGVSKTLEIVSGDDQEGLPGAALDKAFVVEVRNQSDKPLPEVQVTFSVTNGGGTLSATSVTTDANGRAESRLTLGPNLGTNTVTVSVAGITQTETFNAEGIRIPETLEIISGKDQEGLPGEALAKPFVVEVRDRSDKPLPGAQVTFSVAGGGGTLSVTSTTTDSNGRTESTLTLGPNPGTNTVSVSVTGIQTEQTFTAEGIRIPETLEIISGKGQEGLPGEALAKPFVVEVRDQTDKPLPGIEVVFSVTSGGGTLDATSATTDSNGRAESTLTLGPNPGKNTVSVSVTGIQAEQTFTAEGIRIPLAFWIISGDKQQGLPGEALAKPFVVEVRARSGEPLPGVLVTFSVTSGGGTLSVTSATTESGGRAESILTLGPNLGTNTVTVSVTGILEEQSISATAEPPPIPQDVNRDDVVNILDLVLVASDLGDEGADLAADVNGDEVVNILDLVLVAGAFGDVAAPASDAREPAMLTAVDVGQWLAQAQTLDLPDTASREGVLVLEQLLAVLAPKETTLLPNYPNPFNPETWIPYQLAENASVTLTIYDMTGVVVRRLDLGHRLAGYYTNRGKAAHWDGRNESGEPVASGVYFYQLATPSFRDLRRLVILK